MMLLFNGFTVKICEHGNLHPYFWSYGFAEFKNSSLGITKIKESFGRC